jgi:ABC-type dipeptide/oligopeptide/nickel transport system ATPase component
MLINFGIDESSIQIKEKKEESKNDEIKPFSKFRKSPFDIESELSKAQSQSQYDVETFNKFKAIQDEEEKELVKLNPFKQAICVLGESGTGKSVTIENVLSNEGDEYEFIIPTAATTGLLAQFSPSKSTYVPSRLGKMLIEASKNPNKLYTAIFDEMHKSSTIEMINDELLQAISPKRNAGRRFISLDHDTAEIFSDSNLNYERGNILIPDNFGFIFISSKPNVIASNADFFNRVDIINLTEDDRNIKKSMELLSKVISDEDKSSLSKNSLD